VALVTAADFPALLLTAALVAARASAAQPPPDERIVTGVRPADWSDVARQVTVISAADIAVAPSTSVVDLLAREANLNVRSTTGNDRFAGVDIRGMGDTFVSNVLVLVDGVRWNAPDLSGADFGSIALGQIERIEVVRGANAVRYGGGAVGGVINIITRRDDAPTGGTLTLGAGSFGTYDGALDGRLGGEGWAANLRASAQRSDGFRDNGGFDRTDLLLHGQRALNPRLGADLDIQLHRDDYGLPGPLPPGSLAGGRERRRSLAPDDGGETRDNRYRLGLTADWPAGGSLVSSLTYRDRRNEFVLGFTPLLPRADQVSEITEDTVTLDVVQQLAAETPLGPLEATAGALLTRTRYARYANGRSVIDQSTDNRGDLEDGGIYLAAALRPAGWLRLDLGQRLNRTSLDTSEQRLVSVCDFVTVPGLPVSIPTNCRPGTELVAARDDRWRNDATEAGAVVRPWGSVDIHASYARSFRTPNVDELALGVAGLRPQQSSHWEAGFRWRGVSFEGGASLFRLDTDDEILFGVDPDTGATTNFNATERTRRDGGELEARWRPGRRWQLLASVAHVRARFAITGRPVPMVPEWTASAGARYAPAPGVLVSVAARYVGDRPDGNDFVGGAFAEVPAYVVMDAKLGIRLPRLELGLGATNLLDEAAAASVYSGAVYPLAGRALFATVSVPLRRAPTPSQQPERLSSTEELP
jgi:outer membrane receptor protein involved in Fe transport